MTGLTAVQPGQAGLRCGPIGLSSVVLSAELFRLGGGAAQTGLRGDDREEAGNVQALVQGRQPRTFKASSGVRQRQVPRSKPAAGQSSILLEEDQQTTAGSEGRAQRRFPQDVVVGVGVDGDLSFSGCCCWGSRRLAVQQGVNTANDLSRLVFSVDSNSGPSWTSNHLLVWFSCIDASLPPLRVQLFRSSIFASPKVANTSSKGPHESGFFL